MSTNVLAAQPKVEKLQTGLAAADRKKLADGLGAVLGETYVLLIKTHVYHWNVVGPLFLPIHELTEQHYNDLFAATDVIAERIRALGHVTPISFDAMEAKAKVEEASGRQSAEAMIEQLVADHELIVRNIRETTSAAADMSDFVTHDMLNARLAFHEKAIWMLRAILT